MKILVGIIWLALVTVGITVILTYANTPGEAAPKADWPKNTILRLDAIKPTLVMFLHTQCPCSKAAVEEIQSIMNKDNSKEKIIVLYYKPKDKPDSWVTSASLWTKLSNSRVKQVIDTDGVEAKKFNSKTSGQSFLYTNMGQIVFSGGITASRGHSGNSPGQEDIINFVNHPDQYSQYKNSKVFGCSLHNPERGQR